MCGPEPPAGCDDPGCQDCYPGGLRQVELDRIRAALLAEVHWGIAAAQTRIAAAEAGVQPWPDEAAERLAYWTLEWGRDLADRLSSGELPIETALERRARALRARTAPLN
jgi:hypothetical protein